MVDETWLQAFWDCLGAVMGHWYALIPGVALSVIDIIERLRGKEVPIPLRWLFRLFVAGLILAQFMAYWDLRKEIISSHPDLRPKLDSVMVAPAGQNNSDSLVGILGAIRNFVAPGTVADIELTYQVGPNKYTVTWVAEPGDATLATSPGHTTTLLASRYLSAQGRKEPIPTNSQISGWMIGAIKGVPMDMAWKTGNKATLTVVDIY